jgi:hypothetical protein
MKEDEPMFREMLQNKLDGLQSEMAQLKTDKRVGGACHIARMRAQKEETKCRHVTEIEEMGQQRTHRQEKGKNCMELLQRQLATAQANIQAYTEAATAADALWVSHRAMKLQFHTDVCSAWDSEIKLAEQSAGVTPPVDVSGAPPSAGLLPIAANAAPVLPTDNTNRDYDMQVTYTEALFPVVPVENESERAFLSRIWAVCVQWIPRGHCQVMYQELLGEVFANPEGMMAMKTLVGKQIWELFYPNLRVVVLTDVVPSVMRYLLKDIMMKVHKKLESDAAVLKKSAEAIANSFKVMSEGSVSKRRRA